jgi:hypothetical protein
VEKIGSGLFFVIQKEKRPPGLFSFKLQAGIKCKQYSGVTVESGTHVKSVKITLNIPYVPPVLGQILDLISPTKTSISEPIFKSYDPWDMVNCLL